ncbi:(Fe-S)-binding protein [Reyranella sp. CPCC 100927]|uniref:(Fe-S)-binding protein n=1 Tax=Reyranella sp. CPCC 100927 TaxID=2599616 RepID=UPI0011B57FDC|nr:(Fe-S)-binding protein [Reyranella sp. CPCC 100927]TWT15546.1 (Fe-S)-binding protein [Reyranella sp. CPCC 100927]
MDNAGFDAAFARRVDDMLDACTRCGACFTACPITAPAGIADAEPQRVVDGVLDIVRLGSGPDEARRWASTCILSGDCIKACDYGVNPRFLLAVARVKMAKAAGDDAAQRRAGVESFRRMSQDVSVLSRLQLNDAALERLGQRPSQTHALPDADPPLPDVVFYTGCNVLKTPHIALLCLDILDRLGVSYRVMGGPSHCCGILQFRAGDTNTASRFAASTITKLAQSASGQVISWCPSCFVQFSENMLPTFERATGERPFDMTPFMLFLHQHLDRLRPLLCQPVPLRVALHKHAGVAGVADAAAAILRTVPGVELVDLAQPTVGLQSAQLASLPAYKRQLQLAELEAAQAAGVDALAAVYHSDHRDLCAHERDWPFRIVNLLEIVGQSMGIAHEDQYKHLKVMQDADAIVAECGDLLTHHGIDTDLARKIVVKGMLEDQPLPLRG